MEAAHLYCGEFMAGFNLSDCAEFDEWQFFQREHLQQIGLGALDALVTAYEEDGRFRRALSFARRRLSFDRLHEPTHRRLMRLYDRIGEKAATMRQFGQYERILKAELDAIPQPQTVQLYDTIRSNQRTGSVTETAITPKTRYVK